MTVPNFHAVTRLCHPEDTDVGWLLLCRFLASQQEMRHEDAIKMFKRLTFPSLRIVCALASKTRKKNPETNDASSRPKEMKVNDRPQLPSTHHQLWIGNGLEVCDDLSFGGERVGESRRRLMHLVPAPAVRLMKRRVQSRPGLRQENRLCFLGPGSGR